MLLRLIFLFSLSFFANSNYLGLLVIGNSLQHTCVCTDASMIENMLEGLMKVDHMYHVEFDNGQRTPCKSVENDFSDNFFTLSASWLTLVPEKKVEL
jgi:hypothetical protein